MSGVTGLIDTAVADKLSQRADLVRVARTSLVPGPTAATEVEAAVNDVLVASDAPRDRQVFAATALAQGGSPTASVVQALSNAGRAIGTLLADLPAPVGPALGTVPLGDDARTAAEILARNLARAVTGSGLFYESHLAALARGLLDVSALAHEPQSGWTPHTRDAQAHAATGDAAAVIHPQARMVVAQQLDLLATGAFRWCGEAWPGVPMQWVVRKEEHPAERQAGPAQPRWSTSFSVHLPRLGRVHVALTLAGCSLHARVCGETDRAVELLIASAGELTQQAAAAGLHLPDVTFARGTAP